MSLSGIYGRSRWSRRSYNIPVVRLPDGLPERHLSIYRVKNEHLVGQVNLLVSFAIETSLRCVLSRLQPLDNLVATGVTRVGVNIHLRYDPNKTSTVW
jgi:hypothetical protein